MREASDKGGRLAFGWPRFFFFFFSFTLEKKLFWEQLSVSWPAAGPHREEVWGVLTALAAEFTPNIFYVRETEGLLTEGTGESGEICHYSVWLYFVMLCSMLEFLMQTQKVPFPSWVRQKNKNNNSGLPLDNFWMIIHHIYFMTRTHDTIKNKTVFICLTLIKRMLRYIKRRSQGPLQMP